MSDVMTTCNLPGSPFNGWMNYGRLTREQIIKEARDLAKHYREMAEAVEKAPDAAFKVRIVRGVLKQRLIEELKP